MNSTKTLINALLCLSIMGPADANVEVAVPMFQHSTGKWDTPTYYKIKVNNEHQMDWTAWGLLERTECAPGPWLCTIQMVSYDPQGGQHTTPIKQCTSGTFGECLIDATSLNGVGVSGRPGSIERISLQAVRGSIHTMKDYHTVKDYVPPTPPPVRCSSHSNPVELPTIATGTASNTHVARNALYVSCTENAYISVHVKTPTLGFSMGAKSKVSAPTRHYVGTSLTSVPLTFETTVPPDAQSGSDQQSLVVTVELD